MFAPDLVAAIDAATPPGQTHIGIVIKNSDDAVLVTEPQGHPYGVSATFNKVKLGAAETPSAALARCLREQVGGELEGVYPLPTVWATNNSRSFYFVGLYDGQASIGPNYAAWMLPDHALHAISASKGADSRQRDLGLLEAVSGVCVSPHRRVLLMVRELHLMGYEQIRAAPYMYPIAWRCPVVPAAWTWREQGAQFNSYFSGMPDELTSGQGRRHTYSSADGQRPFGWKDAHLASPRELAERFVREMPRVTWAGWGPDEAYVAWYEEMLLRTALNGLIYTQGEFEEPLRDALYAVRCRVQRVPVPPPGLAERGAWDAFGERLSRPTDAE